MNEFLNGKFICTQTDFSRGFMTKGKVYDFKNGLCILDDGKRLGQPKTLESFNKLFNTQIAPYNPQPKNLLTMGRIVKHQNGDMGFVLKHSILYPHGLNPIHIFREDLTTPSGKYDITEIYESTEVSCFNYDNFIEYLGDLVWKRGELTPEQIELEAIEKEQLELAEKQKQLAIESHN